MKPLSIRAGLVVLALAALTGCPDQKEEKKEEASVPVETAKVTVGPIDAAYRGTATLEAEDEAIVLSKGTGVIEQIFVEEGQRVRAGQVLARLETDRLKLEAARARAEADKAQENFDRNTRVFEKNLISKEIYSQSRFTLDSAKAAYDLARLSLAEAEIKAPISGMVSVRYIKVGNQIQPNMQTFKITQMDQLQAQIFVPERDIHKLAPRQAASMALDAWPGRHFRGEIRRVNPVVDATTGTVKVTVAMAPGQPELKPGMFGRVEIMYDRKDQAVLVPKDAVITEDAAESVFLVTEGKAHRRPIKVGYSDAEHYEVLEGLKTGDQVVTTGQANLKDNGKVEVVNAAPAPAAASGTAAQAAAK